MVSVVWSNWCSSIAVERGERDSSQGTMLLRTVQSSSTRYRVFPCYTKFFSHYTKVLFQVAFRTCENTDAMHSMHRRAMHSRSMQIKGMQSITLQYIIMRRSTSKHPACIAASVAVCVAAWLAACVAACVARRIYIYI